MKNLKWLRWLWPALIALVAVGLYVLLPYFPDFTEQVISRGLFRVVGFPVQWVVSLLPVSLTELLVVLGIPAAVVLLVIWVVRLCRGPHRLQRLERGLRFAAWCVSLVLLVFMLTCGGNFSRRPLAQLMDLPNRQYTVEELAAVTADLAAKVSAAREQVAEDEAGCMTLSASLSDTLLAADDAYDALRQDYPFLTTAVWRVKPVALSHLWSYTGYVGVYCPWLGESSVNVDAPYCDLGHTATHELAHTMGFAKEKECNFLAYLACITSGQPDYVYSGYLSAYIYCSNTLYKADKAAWGESYKACSPAVRRDLKQRNAYWKQFQGEVMESSQQVNDTFIKVNGVESGSFSYGEMVELVLQHYDKTGWLAALNKH